MKKLPYRARTASGDTFDIEFPLHPETGDSVRVAQLVSLLLDALDRDIAVLGETSNGDVLQAMAMAMAIRAEMIYASSEITDRLSQELLRVALQAAANSKRESPQVGHA